MPSPTNPTPEAPLRRGDRLQKVLAAAGIGSRRDCETLILEGRVEVDRKVVRELGCRVDPAKQAIRVDGVALRPHKRVYFLLNKPPGVLCTNRDPDGRTRVIDLIDSDERLFPVGRLDRSSEGLMLVTNDGALANQLTHPRYGVQKTYRVEVAGRPSRESLERLKRGVHLAEGMARATSLRVLRQRPHSTYLEMVLREGRNREIRRLLARIGHKVLRLQRVALGPLRLADLPLGAHRRLSREEVRLLERSVGQGGASAAAAAARPRAARNRPPASPPQGKTRRRARSRAGKRNPRG